MKRITAPNSQLNGFNLTPMIDIIFQLIIFFLCVNQFQKAERDETITLPEASSSHVETLLEEERAPLVLNIRPDEGVYVSGERVAAADLERLLTRAKREAGADLELWIRADREVAYRTVEPVLLACAKAGIWKVAFKVVTEEQAVLR
jgi:biopolymer transport protein ExbD